MSGNETPEWMNGLEAEDLNFIKNFLLASGSLKEISQQYEISYPTVRTRLDRLIQKIRWNEEKADEPYIRLIKRLALEEKLDIDTAKMLIVEYRKGHRDDV